MPRKEEFLKTTHVKCVTVIDPETGNGCEIEIRKIEGGPLVGLDASYLESIGGPDIYEVYPVSPYDGKPLLVPDNEW